MPNTVKPLVKFVLFASAVVTRFEELSPTLPTTPDVVPVLEQVDDVVDAVDAVDVVDVVAFLQPGIRNYGRETTRTILSNFIFSSSGNNPNVN